MRIKVIITLLLYVFISHIGCTDKGGSTIITYMRNFSGHDIEIRYYRDGVLSDPSGKVLSKTGSKFIQIRNGETIEIDSGSDFGKFKGALIPQADSALVLFDKQVIAYHYGFNISGSNLKGISFDNSRNVFTSKDYVELVIKETNDSFYGEFTYTFTEQDYVNAH